MEAAAAPSIWYATACSNTNLKRNDVSKISKEYFNHWSNFAFTWSNRNLKRCDDTKYWKNISTFSFIHSQNRIFHWISSKLSIPMSTTPSFKFYLTTSSGANLYRSVLLLLSKNSFFRIPKYRKRMITPSPRQFEWKRNVGKKKFCGNTFGWKSQLSKFFWTPFGKEIIGAETVFLRSKGGAKLRLITAFKLNNNHHLKKSFKWMGISLALNGVVVNNGCPHGNVFVRACIYLMFVNCGRPI